jgi:hypothetical protein
LRGWSGKERYEGCSSVDSVQFALCNICGAWLLGLLASALRPETGEQYQLDQGTPENALEDGIDEYRATEDAEWLQHS